ncbi:DUF4383 domain-containing protein [Leptolyngbya sp. FACHB-321]|uniref:DUF4383 domain-containing protein n=1 Tax=Leptolyngbya sp. FACHB-321 TaxID=2692807 RepID=UPI001686C53E|nr:DUF4383 domain-containing protein [Leptolyngbya sp. FACHB-321]MBD2037065.1 DUF4383 domain-containing protein [Leptolyngbya sp. FACHB-321]
MKAGQYFALTIGIIFVLIGVAGFIPDLVKPPIADPDAVNLSYIEGYGYLMGLFPINVLHNIVHLTVGLLGIFASLSLGSARLFSGVLALFYGLLTILGLFPPTQSMLGLVPLFGNDLWLHAGTAVIATYFGFLAKPDLLELREQGHDEQANPSS